MPWLFAFFLTSGFCSLVYQVVWLRLAMADFGVNTLLVSIVLSVFMGGLALGSWGAGGLAHRLAGRTASAFLRLYGGTEFLIGVSGLLVVPALGLGRRLLAAGGTAPWGSGYYYLASGAWITLALLPFCACMGATFPLAMAGVRAAFPCESPRSLSVL
jgi:spermidine synthase